MRLQSSARRIKTGANWRPLLTTSLTSFSATRSFCAAGEPHVAICLQPGTELAFDIEALDDFSFLRAIRKRKSRGRVAQFREVNMHRPNVHHDALEFPDGEIVTLTGKAHL